MIWAYYWVWPARLLNTQPPNTWECSNSTLLIYFLSSLLHLDGDWMYVGGTAGVGRRAR